MLTGKMFHTYLNPERDISEAVVKVHGITSQELKGSPLFSEIAEDFLGFIKDSPLVIHNAPFDMGFLNAELEKIGKPALTNQTIDTKEIAKNKSAIFSNRKLDALVEWGVNFSQDMLQHAGMINDRMRPGSLAEKKYQGAYDALLSGDAINFRKHHGALIDTLLLNAVYTKLLKLDSPDASPKTRVNYVVVGDKIVRCGELGA